MTQYDFFFFFFSSFPYFVLFTHQAVQLHRKASLHLNKYIFGIQAISPCSIHAKRESLRVIIVDNFPQDQCHLVDTNAGVNDEYSKYQILVMQHSAVILAKHRKNWDFTKKKWVCIQNQIGLMLTKKKGALQFNFMLVYTIWTTQPKATAKIMHNPQWCRS